MGLKFTFAFKAVHHGGRFAVQAVQHIAIAVGCRIRHGDAMERQVLHQPQVKRQLLRRQPFEQGQHIGRLIGSDKVVGVLNAAGAALHGLESAQLQGGKKSAGLVERDLCVNRHGAIVGGAMTCKVAQLGTAIRRRAAPRRISPLRGQRPAQRRSVGAVSACAGHNIRRRAAPRRMQPLGGQRPTKWRSVGAQYPLMTESKKTLLLVDGSSYLYRAFFAGGDSMSVTLRTAPSRKPVQCAS